ncbi:MAG: hypothetical protein DRO01_07155 [Thermoproteota archaeon]|nr:MAG: hypothetical protein DRO01_07155 [Candidatus Korarchaeota archaeon]
MGRPEVGERWLIRHGALWKLKEVIIVEFSPSRKYVKLSQDGSEYWERSDSVEWVEKLLSWEEKEK